MPVKNAQAWLPECLESIQRQTFEQWELIAIDDGSEDESLHLLLDLAKVDSRIRPIAAMENGISAALQQAYECAQGQFVTRMDADDIMPTQKLEWMLAKAQAEPAKVVTGKVQYFDSTGTVSKGYREYEAWLNERIDNKDHSDWRYRECSVAGANWLCHRKLLPSRFDALLYPEDYDLVFYWHKNNVPITGLNAVTHHWREHAERTSRNHKHYSQRYFFELKLKRFLEIDREAARPLAVLGKGTKAKLAQEILRHAGSEPIMIDEAKASILDDLSNPQVLAAVYPPPRQREALSEWLLKRNLMMGFDWWWL